MAGSATGDGFGASAVPSGLKKEGREANASIILTSDDFRIGQLTNVSFINDNNTLVWLFSASGGCHQIHF